MSADLGGEIDIKTKPLEVYAEHFRKLDDAHFLLADLEAVGMSQTDSKSTCMSNS